MSAAGRIDDDGRRRISEFVRAWLGWSGRDASKKLAETGIIGMTTIKRAQRGEEMSETTYRALGIAMELPRDFLLYIGYGQIDRIEKATDDADLIRWSKDHLFPRSENVTEEGPRSTGTTGE